MRGPCTMWCLVTRCDLPGDKPCNSGSVRGLAPGDKDVPPGDLVQEMLCHERRGRFVCSALTLERCYVRGGTYLVDHVCWTTGGQVYRVGLRAGRFVEVGPRAGSSPFLFVFGDDRVIRYMGADDITGDVGDA
ncbi:hypothetical protein DEO72_LG4g593 [Vigna unguiculata]|uniref:Uncharacterized protein n=1 Tax=Vigna unguiculata TaxID=3917 RepID=A0A4D6LM36_VIGUN|nr:hypothetical protein DEO72_LG4g593 [Vigna unguiculata]